MRRLWVRGKQAESSGPTRCTTHALHKQSHGRAFHSSSTPRGWHASCHGPLRSLRLLLEHATWHARNPAPRAALGTFAVHGKGLAEMPRSLWQTPSATLLNRNVAF